MTNNEGEIIGYTIVSAAMMSVDITTENLTSSAQMLEKNGYVSSDVSAMFGWHGENYNDNVPTTIAFDAVNYFPSIQPAADGKGLDSEHMKDIGVVVYKAYLDPTEGN